MELAELIESLSDGAAYPFSVKGVDVCQTHISVVFLAGPYAYKIKKPVNLGFLDFSTLEKRHHYCCEEVRLNRRLAPGVYLGVVPITRDGIALKVEGPGEAVEWAVKMQRLPDQATLEKRLQRGEVDPSIVSALAKTIAHFHASAEGGPRVSTFGNFDVVARNMRENFTQSQAQVGVTVSRAVFERLRSLTEKSLAELRPMIEARARRGCPRDTHGDLHLDHVYLFPERKSPADLVIVDCIEFNERFRYADPVADMAFLAMDLAFHGRRDLAENFANVYFDAAHDAEGRALLPFYAAYRAIVRGKVEGFELAQKEMPQGEREVALERARAHWLLALGELEEKAQRPCLVLIGGLPGTGKSTLARGLADRANFHLVRSDEVRKRIAGLSADRSAASCYGEGIYEPSWTQRTYFECMKGASRLLMEGKRVIVDASFGQEKHRKMFLDAAAVLRVPTVFFLCEASPELIRGRLEQRRGDASDADLAIYDEAAKRWEAIGSVRPPLLRAISTTGSESEAIAEALGVLSEIGLTERSTRSFDQTTASSENALPRGGVESSPSPYAAPPR